MSNELNIDLGSAIPYLVNETLSLFGKDSVSRQWEARLQRRVETAADHAKAVQCIGMPEPIPIQQIYQPLTLVSQKHSSSSTSLETLISRGQEAVIHALPGQGKTTLLNWTYLKLLAAREVTPVLFILRNGDAVSDLQEFVGKLREGQPTKVRGRKLKNVCLLVDGYDEVSRAERREVSEALADFRSMGRGAFYLTCRTFYDVIDLSADRYHLAEFSGEDSERFIRAFGRNYSAKLDPVRLRSDLERRGLKSFAGHPLLLTLVCILQTGPNKELPTNTIGLLRRAIDTLTFRWDEQRGIARKSKIPLDGEERVRVLMRIAHSMTDLQARDEQVEAVVGEHLRLIRMARKVEARRLLGEMAQWYGLFIPISGDLWQFTHRSIHDYLAARYMVESGSFRNRFLNWGPRSAYAACLLPDATDVIEATLSHSSDLGPLIECLVHNAPFDTDRIAKALREHFVRVEPGQIRATGSQVSLDVDWDFSSLMASTMLHTLLRLCLSAPSAVPGNDLLLGVVLSELLRRGEQVTTRLFVNISNEKYQNPQLSFSVTQGGEVRRFRLCDVLKSET